MCHSTMHFTLKKHSLNLPFVIPYLADRSESQNQTPYQTSLHFIVLQLTAFSAVALGECLCIANVCEIFRKWSLIRH